MDIGDLRRDYMSEGLDHDQLHENPFVQFERWFRQAQDAGLEDVNAMSLASTGADGLPNIRTVLLKIFDEQGFVFFTNYESAKAKEIEKNPQAALLFPWLPLNRQVKIRGSVERISQMESLKYFATRPRGSQLGAWCSQQSHAISSRSMLEAKLMEIKSKFARGEVPLPSFWGGYRVVPRYLEFWQGRPDRLHDRFQYSLLEDGSWEIARLQP